MDIRERPIFRYNEEDKDMRVHVQQRMCDTCIFRPGNLMHLEEGRVESMVEGCGEDGIIPCHEHMDTDTPGVCHGQYTKHRNQVLQIAERFKVVKFQ